MPKDDLKKPLLEGYQEEYIELPVLPVTNTTPAVLDLLSPLLARLPPAVETPSVVFQESPVVSEEEFDFTPCVEPMGNRGPSFPCDAKTAEIIKKMQADTEVRIHRVQLETMKVIEKMQLETTEAIKKMQHGITQTLNAFFPKVREDLARFNSDVTVKKLRKM